MREKITPKFDLFFLYLKFNKVLGFNKTHLKKTEFFKYNLISVLFLSSFFFISIASYGQITLNTRQSGNWNSVNTWVSSNLSGTITTSTSTNRTTVTGNGTNFLNQLQVGSVLYRTGGTAIIGTVATINSNTSITLTANALNTGTNLNYVTRKIPTVLDKAVLLNNDFDVAIPSGYNAFCETLEIGTFRSGSSEFIDFIGATSTLTVTGNTTIFGPTSNQTREIKLYSGTMNVGGNLYFGSGQNGDQSNRVSKLTISTGTMTVSGNLIFDNIANSSALQTQINMFGGVFNLAGNFIINNNRGTLSSSDTSVFNFNGNNAQTIPIGISNAIYSNINCNNTSSAGATLSAAIAISNVTGNLSIQSGSLNNGGFAIVGTSSKTISVANGASLILIGTTAFPTGFSTTTLGVSSTVDYNGTTQTVATKNYGNLSLSTSGNKTFAGVTTIAGNLAISGTAKALLPNGTISSADTITLGEIDQTESGSWGSLGSSATNKTNIWFASANSGIVNISRPCTITTATAGDNQSNCIATSFTMSGNTAASGETGKWTLVSGTATITNSTSPTSTITGVTAGTSATLRWTITKTLGECKSFDDVVLTVSPIVNSGIISNAASVCSGFNATALTLTGNSSSVLRWESSTDNFVTNTTIISNTTSNLVVTNLLETTNYRVVTPNGICPAVFSPIATIFVNPNAIAGSISNNTSVCPGINSTIISLSGNSGSIQWQSSLDNSNFSNIPGAFNSNLTATNLTETTFYKAVVTNGNCSVNSDISQIAIKNTTFDGTFWSNGLPDSTSTISFNFTGNYTLNSDIAVCSCTINNGNVIVASNKTLTLLNSLNVINGSITFDDKSSLVQTNNVINSGQILYKRNTSSLFNNYDFVYWSSPVVGQTLNTIWMSPNSNSTFYTYNNTTNNWAGANANSVMQPGIGYIARARSGTLGIDYAGVATTFNLGSTWLAKFFGTPNNGNFALPIYKTGNDFNNLIGNPYPSAIDMKLFNDDADNSGKLTGNFLFWTHATPVSANAYNASDYAIYNANTSVSVSGNRGFFPDQYIDSGQSFFIEAIDNGVLTFKNSHRVAGNNNNFYRPASANTNTITTIESHNIWLNLSNSEGIFKQQLVQYAEGASDNYDVFFDAISPQGNPNFDFYSSIPNYKFTLQSKGLPFDANNTVTLGYKVAIPGTYQIEIDHLDGLFADDQNIYLEDSQTNQLINIKAGPYSFQTAVGEYPNRFVLHYLPIVLGTDYSIMKNSIQVFTNKNDKLTIYSSIQNIKNLVIYDMLGRTIDSFNNLNLKEFTMNNFSKSVTPKVVKITLENDEVVMKKAIF